MPIRYMDSTKPAVAKGLDDAVTGCEICDRGAMQGERRAEQGRNAFSGNGEIAQVHSPELKRQLMRRTPACSTLTGGFVLVARHVARKRIERHQCIAGTCRY